MAIIFGALIGTVARILLPGRQRIGIFLTVLIGAAAALGGTWLANRWNWHSTRTFQLTLDWLVIAIQVGIAIIGVAIAALLARTFTTDKKEDAAAK